MLNMDLFSITTTGLSQVVTFFNQPVLTIIIALFAIGGWLFFVNLLLYVGLEFYVDYRQGKGTKDWEWVVLAIDIPAINIQTPVAVEQLFSHLAGAYQGNSIEGKYYEGFAQRNFSFEIISIEGYIQFLIRTEKSLEDLVKASIYAQYPEAEIIEVEDYTNELPDQYPNDTHDLWSADFALAENEAYPIRTYPEFEHSIVKDDVFKDPMSAFLESFSRIGRGEQMWFQIIITPISGSWKEKAILAIKELMGDDSHKKVSDHIGDKFVRSLDKGLETLGDNVFNREASEASKDGDKGDKKVLTPGERKVLEGMERKISKTGFKTKVRAVYVAKKGVFKPSKGIPALIGSINQFNSPTSNSLVPKFSTGTSYLFKAKQAKAKKTLMMKSYKKRKAGAGANTYILNVEELATLWHFPMSSVQTPLLQKSSGKRAEPPSSLPIDITEDLVGHETKPEEVEEIDFMKFG